MLVRAVWSGGAGPTTDSTCAMPVAVSTRQKQYESGPSPDGPARYPPSASSRGTSAGGKPLVMATVQNPLVPARSPFAAEV